MIAVVKETLINQKAKASVTICGNEVLSVLERVPFFLSVA